MDTRCAATFRRPAAVLSAAVVMAVGGIGCGGGTPTTSTTPGTLPTPPSRLSGYIPVSMQWHMIDLPHQTGCLDGEAWAATPGHHAPGLLQYGPNADQVPPGNLSAVWDLALGTPGSNAGNEAVARLDVYDAATDTVLASREVRRSDFPTAGPYEYHSLHLPFALLPSQAERVRLEMRVHWYGNAYLRGRILRCVRW